MAPEPIGEPRRMYSIRLEATVEATVVARSHAAAIDAVDFDNWTTDPVFDVVDSFEITTIEAAEDPAGGIPRCIHLRQRDDRRDPRGATAGEDRGGIPSEAAPASGRRDGARVDSAGSR